jgi:predicted transcriptional regulator
MTRIPDKKNVKRNLPSVGQIRGARGLIGWTQTDLAAAAGLSLPTIARF